MAPQLTWQTRLVSAAPEIGGPREAQQELMPDGDTHLLRPDGRRTVCGDLVSVHWVIQELPSQPTCDDCFKADSA